MTDFIVIVSMSLTFPPDCRFHSSMRCHRVSSVVLSGVMSGIAPIFAQYSISYEVCGPQFLLYFKIFVIFYFNIFSNLYFSIKNFLHVLSEKYTYNYQIFVFYRIIQLLKHRFKFVDFRTAKRRRNEFESYINSIFEFF